MTVNQADASNGDAIAKGIPEKVTVDLYGGKPVFGKGKEKPLRAHEVWCSLPGSKTECPFRAKGKCLCVTSGFSSTRCPYGKTTVIRGYTSRAKKYLEFRRRYEEDPAYSTLDQPSGDAFHVARIGGYVAIAMPYTNVAYDPQRRRADDDAYRYGRNGNVIVAAEDVGFFSLCDRVWIPVEDIDASVFVALGKLVPRERYNRVKIKEYQEKVVPAMIEELRLEWPEMYDEVIAQCPEMAGRQVDHRGRKALILTLRDGIAIRMDSSVRKDEFVLDTKAATLTCTGYHDSLILGLGSVRARGDATLILHVREGDEIEIQDNSWVVPGKTMFV